MGQQTNISFYAEGSVVPDANTVLNTLRVLGVDETVAFVTKYASQTNAWENRGGNSLPAWEFNRHRVSLADAVRFVGNGDEIVISVVETEGGLGKRLIIETWQAIPESLAQGCVIGNNDCTIGLHDVFGMVSQNEEKDTYISRTPFSITFWGYRCPKDIDEFRRIVEDLPIISEIKTALSEALNQPVRTAVYMNL
jgi:hypothetical protein